MKRRGGEVEREGLLARYEEDRRLSYPFGVCGSVTAGDGLSSEGLTRRGEG